VKINPEDMIQAFERASETRLAAIEERDRFEDGYAEKKDLLQEAIAESLEEDAQEWVARNPNASKPKPVTLAAVNRALSAHSEYIGWQTERRQLARAVERAETNKTAALLRAINAVCAQKSTIAAALAEELTAQI
jgi:hypothetical protein